MNKSEIEKLITELRASAKECRSIVEGPSVKFEVKQMLRRLCMLSEQAVAEMQTSIEHLERS